MSHINAAKTASVSDVVFWKPIDRDTPRGVKIQLIAKPYGVAHYGVWHLNDGYYTHWQDLPRFKKEPNE